MRYVVVLKCSLNGSTAYARQINYILYTYIYIYIYTCIYIKNLLFDSLAWRSLRLIPIIHVPCFDSSFLGSLSSLMRERAWYILLHVTSRVGTRLTRLNCTLAHMEGCPSTYNGTKTTGYSSHKSHDHMVDWCSKFSVLNMATDRVIGKKFCELLGFASKHCC